jgi:hypothetical protein
LDYPARASHRRPPEPDTDFGVVRSQFPGAARAPGDRMLDDQQSGTLDKDRAFATVEQIRTRFGRVAEAVPASR